MSRLRVTWHTEPSWFARVFRRLKSVERSATFAGTGDVWHWLPDWQRASPAFERELRKAESRFLSTYQELRVAPSQDSVQAPGRDSTAAVQVPERVVNETPDLQTRSVQVEHLQPVVTVHAHSKAEVTTHRRFRRMKLH